MKYKKKIKAAIIGYGSIGELHLQTLRKFKKISEILIISNRGVDKKKKVNFSNNLDSIISYDPDYVIVSSPTSQHYKDFCYIEKNLKNKIILFEKPIFDRNIKLKKKLNNKYLVNYNLRELNLIKYIKTFIRKTSYFNVDINCSSYLPLWRKNISYSESSSGKKELGGGVINDLSHEIDYALSIFGDFKVGYSYTSKISNLDINTNDFFTAFLFIKNKPIKISLNYFSKIPKREIIINSNNFQLNANLIENFIRIKIKKKKEKIISFKDSIRGTYKIVHRKILNDNLKNLCSIKEGMKVVKYLKKFNRK